MEGPRKDPTWKDAAPNNRVSLKSGKAQHGLFHGENGKEFGENKYLRGMFTQGWSFFAKVVEEQLQSLTTHSKQNKVICIGGVMIKRPQFIWHLPLLKGYSDLPWIIFWMRPVVVANRHRGKVNCIFMAEHIDILIKVKSFCLFPNSFLSSAFYLPLPLMFFKISDFIWSILWRETFASF